MHVFAYTERSNTSALKIKPVVPVSIRNERTKTLRSLSYKKLQKFTSQHIGETRKVLFEGRNKNGMMEGYTDNYIKVNIPYNAEWTNNIIDWKI